MKTNYVRMVLGIAILTVVLLASCDLFGSDDDAISATERRDIFISHLLNQQYDRLTQNMDPNISGIGSWGESTWRDALQVTGSPTWSFGAKTSDTVVINSVSGIGRAPGIFYFSYVRRGDIHYFSKIEWDDPDVPAVPKAQIVP